MNHSLESKMEFLMKLLVSMDMKIPIRRPKQSLEEYLEILRYEVADSVRAYTKTPYLF